MLKLGSNQEFLSNEQINEICPSVFTSKPSTTVSEKYTHIPTSRVIEDMRSLGWDVVDAKQVQSRKEKTNGVGKHLVIFRNDDVVVSGSDGDTVYPQILLTNSHDGKNAFQFQAGLFRLVCENGLVISTQDFEKVKIRHMGYTFEELQTQIRAMVERLPLTVESMNKMKQIELNEEQMVEFATPCTGNYDSMTAQMERIAIDINQLLAGRPKRRQGQMMYGWYLIVSRKNSLNGGFNYGHPEVNPVRHVVLRTSNRMHV
jgi:hypothetical protein